MEESTAVQLLGALAHPTRLAVFRHLLLSAPESRPAGLISEALGIAPATLSFHLAELRRAGLILSRRESRSIMYAASERVMRDLVAYLVDDCCGGRPELCGVATPRPIGRLRPPRSARR